MGQAALRKELAESEASNAHLVEEVQNVLARRDALLASRDRLEAEVGVLKHQVLATEATLEQRIQELEAENQELHEQLDASSALEGRIQELEAKNQELHEQLDASSAQGQGMTWEYEAEHQRWCSMSSRASERLVKAYKAFLESGGSRSVRLDLGHGIYDIDFHTWIPAMTQCNTRTMTKRKIRLRSDAPPCWSASVRDLLRESQPSLQQLLIEEESPAIWEKVQEFLRGSGHGPLPNSTCSVMQSARVNSLQRIENYPLWRKYLDKCKQMADGETYSLQPLLGSNSVAMRGAAAALTAHFRLGNEANQVWLFHGSTWPNIEQIVQMGFDNRLAKQGFYGYGTYFASESCKSHQYTSDQSRWMVLARVAVGSPHYTKKVCRDLRRPPKREGVARLHDCVVANPGIMAGHRHGQQAHQEFVIFEGAQAYPCFLVNYSV